MQYLYISDMEEEDYQKYLDILAPLDRDERLKVIINSGGGQTLLEEILRDEILEFNDYEIQVKDAQSNGLVLLDEIAHKATNISFSPIGKHIAHISRLNVAIGDGGKPLIGWDKYKEYCQSISSPYMFQYLTRKEKSGYLKGEDIYITPQRLEKYYSKINKLAK